MLPTFPVQDLSRISARLHDEFATLSRRRVERCVSDAWTCAEHLGITLTPHLLERVAREHLEAAVNSVPPSGGDRPSEDEPGPAFAGRHAVPGPR